MVRPPMPPLTTTIASLSLLLGVLPRASLGFVVPSSSCVNNRGGTAGIKAPRPSFGGGWRDDHDDGTRLATSLCVASSASDIEIVAEVAGVLKHKLSAFASAVSSADLLPSSLLATIGSSSLSPLLDPLLWQHMATGGVLAFAGDVIAQSLLSKSEKKSFPPEDWDTARTAAFVAFGALYTGGAQHFVFGFLNASFDEPLVRLALAQFFFIPFCYYPTFLFMVPALRAAWEPADDNENEGEVGKAGGGGKNFKERRDELFAEVASRIPSTLLRNWCFWLPVQFVQFNFVPPDAQVTFAAAFGVVWNAILSWSTAASTSNPEEELSTTAAKKKV